MFVPKLPFAQSNYPSVHSGQLRALQQRHIKQQSSCLCQAHSGKWQVKQVEEAGSPPPFLCWYGSLKPSYTSSHSEALTGILHTRSPTFCRAHPFSPPPLSLGGGVQMKQKHSRVCLCRRI